MTQTQTDRLLMRCRDCTFFRQGEGNKGKCKHPANLTRSHTPRVRNRYDKICDKFKNRATNGTD